MYVRIRGCMPAATYILSLQYSRYVLNLDGDGFYAQDPSSSAASEVGRQSHVGTYNKTCLTYPPQEENLVLVACLSHQKRL